MNICILTRPDLIPTNHGAAVKIIRTAQSFTSLGSKCCIVTEDRDHYWIMGADGELQPKDYPSKYRAMQEWPFIRMGSTFAERVCRRLGYPKEEWFLYTAQFDPAWLIRVLSVGMVEEIDIFQSEFPGYGLVAWLAAELLTRGERFVGSSIVQHNVEWERLTHYGHQSPWIKRMERLALDLVDDVIAVSSEDKELMLEMGIDPSKISIVPHGVNGQEIREAVSRRQYWREQYSVQDKVVVFFHGTLHYAPNTEAVRFIATEILPLLDKSDFADLVFVIVGMNPPLYYQHPQIVFTDVVDDLSGHLQMADIFVCPLFDGGGTRLKLLEYLAVGRPIITTRKGAEGIPDRGQFEYAETAIEFVRKLTELLPNLPMISKTKQRIADQLDWRNVTESYFSIYQQSMRGIDFFQRILSQPPKPTVPEASYLPNYRPSKPRTLLLLVNRGCNLQCVFCDLWDNPEYMPLQKLLPILDDAVQIGTKTLVITGGEPLMHPNIEEIILAAKSRGLTVNMTTNGLLVPKHWSWLQSSGIDSLSFSLDGIDDVHDLLRKRDGAYKKTVEAMLRVKSESTITCSVYCTVTNKNVHQLARLHHLTMEWGVNFDFWPVNDAPDLYLNTPEHHDHWNNAVEVITERNPDYSHRKSFYEDALKYHNFDPIRNIRCLGFVDQYGITYTGDLLPCCVWDGRGLVKGNVFQDSLKDLWFSDTIQRYRKEMVEEGCSVGCFNHSLYEYRQATEP